MTHRWSLVARLPLLMVLLTGCTVYRSNLTLRPASPKGETTKAMVTLENEKVAREVVSEIADRYGMRMVPGPYDHTFTDPFRGLLLFKGHGIDRDVALGAMVHKNGATIVFTVTDQVHGGQTELIFWIERDLDEAAARRFPDFSRTWNRSSVPRNPLAP